MYIDIYLIKLCDSDMLDRFFKVCYISEYIEIKINELCVYYWDYFIDEFDLLNSCWLINIGMFCVYLEVYLCKYLRVN